MFSFGSYKPFFFALDEKNPTKSCRTVLLPGPSPQISQLRVESETFYLPNDLLIQIIFSTAKPSIVQFIVINQSFFWEK